MPNIYVETNIKQSAETVFNRFGDGLFEQLVPWFAKPERNDGVEVGDLVSVGFRIPFMKTWHSKITDRGEDASSFWFTDEGISGMPFGIKQWKHVHRVKKVSLNECIIAEEIFFETGHSALNSLCLIIFTQAMKGRKKKYQDFFEKNESRDLQS